ncbi:MAG: hypothetical protein AB7O43_06205 [Hyphomicrobiaceae bacterium]
MFWGLFRFVQELAILAAAIGVAKWAWDQHVRGPMLRSEAARVALAEERERAELKAAARQWGARMEAIAVDISTRLDEVLVRQRDQEVREDLKVAIHRLLQTSGDPYLTADEIIAALSPQPPAEPDLRRALMELVAGGVVAQLDHDRYFIATAFETEEEHEDA